VYPSRCNAAARKRIQAWVRRFTLASAAEKLCNDAPLGLLSIADEVIG
jgi:hypothetical protein